MSKDNGRAFQLTKIEGISPEVATFLQEWLEKKWNDNCRYGDGSIKVFTEIAEEAYRLGKESKEN